MIYRIYPYILLPLCQLMWMASMFLTLSFAQRWMLFLWPIPIGLMGVLIMRIIASRYPRIVFVDAREEFAAGFTHKPTGILFPFLICTYVIAAATVWWGGLY